MTDYTDLLSEINETLSNASDMLLRQYRHVRDAPQEPVEEEPSGFASIVLGGKKSSSTELDDVLIALGCSKTTYPNLGAAIPAIKRVGEVLQEAPEMLEDLSKEDFISAHITIAKLFYYSRRCNQLVREGEGVQTACIQ